MMSRMGVLDRDARRFSCTCFPRPQAARSNRRVSFIWDVSFVMSNHNALTNSSPDCDKRRAAREWARGPEGANRTFPRGDGFSMTHPDTSSVLDRRGHRPIGDAAALRARLVPELRQLLDGGRAEAEAHLL